MKLSHRPAVPSTDVSYKSPHLVKVISGTLPRAYAHYNAHVTHHVEIVLLTKVTYTSAIRLVAHIMLRQKLNTLFWNNVLGDVFKTYVNVL